MEKAVLVDLDDTLNALQTRINGYVNAQSQTKYHYHRLTSYERESGDPALDEIVQEFLHSPQLVIKSQPFPHALAGVQLLHQNGYAIHITSARKESLHQVTVDWLDLHGMSPYITNVPPRPADIFGPDFKIQVAQKVAAQTIFDDTKRVAEAFAQNMMIVYLIRRPWNKELLADEFIKPYPSFYRAVLGFLKENHGTNKT